MNALVVFAEAARAYCALLENPPASAKAERLLERIAHLYAAGLMLPLAEVGEDDIEIDLATCPTADAWADLEVQCYGETMEPLSPESQAVGVGDVLDDILDIYSDVEGGLHVYDAGHHLAAHWHWRLHLNSHWGTHATSALRALHHLVIRNRT